MAEIIVLLVFLFFSSIGAGYVTYRLWLFLIRPKMKNKIILVTRLDGDCQKEQFMYCFEKYRWCGNDYADRIITVCDGEIDETCEAFNKCYENIVCCTSSQLPLILKCELEEQSG
ncbi:MAG: hypothetical protein U0M42_05460 [Acutalibacteraceae bacterium]|nr:hypothetical protein [Acutalibacteraceae bacterium]